MIAIIKLLNVKCHENLGLKNTTLSTSKESLQADQEFHSEKPLRRIHTRPPPNDPEILRRFRAGRRLLGRMGGADRADERAAGLTAYFPLCICHFSFAVSKARETGDDGK